MADSANSNLSFNGSLTRTHYPGFLKEKPGVVFLPGGAFCFLCLLFSAFDLF